METNKNYEKEKENTMNEADAKKKEVSQDVKLKRYEKLLRYIVTYAATRDIAGYEKLSDLDFTEAEMMELGFPEDVIAKAKKSREEREEAIIARVEGILDELGYKDKGGDYCYQIYTSYDDEVSDSTLQEIADENPECGLEEQLDEWANDYACDYGYGEIEKQIRDKLTESEEEDFDEFNMDEWLQEHLYFYYDADDFNRDVYVNIVIDAGDANYDFTKNNILSSYYGENGEFEEESSILWLAKQQGKEVAVRAACKAVFREDGNYLDREVFEKDTFTESVVQELENTSSGLNALVFLVKMDVKSFLKIAALRKQNEKANASYTLSGRTGTGSITVGWETMCGLFDMWNGGGSVLEIKLNKNVEIPLKMIHSFHIDQTVKYDVGDVYGLCKSAWKESLKKITEDDEKSSKKEVKA